MKKYLVAGAALAALLGCKSSETPETTPPSELSDDISFVVIGDTPYDKADKKLLEEALPKIKAGKFPFVIHVGDYRPGSVYCTAQDDQDHKDRIDFLAPIPVFYTPGDNEWADCDRSEPRNAPATMSELARLDHIRDMFFGKNSVTAHGAIRQNNMPENARWTYKNVQFATLHIVATNNARSQVRWPDDLEIGKQAADTRDRLNIEWLTETMAAAKAADASAVVIAAHADMTELHKSQTLNMPCTEVSEDYLECDAFTDLRKAIQAAANGFDGPMILIHGDSFPFTLNQKFLGAEAPNLWRLNAAGDVGRDGFGSRDVTLVTIHPDKDIPISASGFVTGKKPKTR